MNDLYLRGVKHRRFNRLTYCPITRFACGPCDLSPARDCHAAPCLFTLCLRLPDHRPAIKLSIIPKWLFDCQPGLNGSHLILCLRWFKSECS